MNIVFLSPHSDPEAKIGEVDSGGQCIYEYELANSLSNNLNVAVTVYCRRKFGYPKISKINPRFTIKRITCGGNRFIPKEQLDPVLDEFARKVYLDLRKNPPDVIHSHYWDGGKVSILEFNYFGHDLKLVWTPHSLGSVKRRSFSGIKNEIKFNFIPRIAWENYTLFISDVVIVSTEDEKNRVFSDYGIEEDKIKVIPPAVNQQNFNFTQKKECRERFKLPLDKPMFISLGRLDRRKGYHHSIKAFARFRQIYKIDAILVVFAGNSKKQTIEEDVYMSDLKELVREYHLGSQVYFFDAINHDEVKYIYGAADVYLCLSDYEPFGLTILEAMLTGVPVVATKNGGPVNIITPGVNGYLVQPNEENAVAYEMYRLIRDDKLRQKIISRAKAHVVNYYTWDVRAKEFYGVYSELSKGKRMEIAKQNILKNYNDHFLKE